MANGGELLVGGSDGRRKSWTNSYKTYNPLDSEKVSLRQRAEGRTERPLGIHKEFRELVPPSKVPSL